MQIKDNFYKNNSENFIMRGVALCSIKFCIAPLCNTFFRYKGRNAVYKIVNCINATVCCKGS